MKISFVGKGGSGKTTLSALFTRHLTGRGARVVAIDADINQQLAVSLGSTEERASALRALGDNLDEIKDYLRGTNPRIRSAAAMVKTTPPGRGSRVLRVGGDDPIHGRLCREIGGVPLMVTGDFTEADLGVACYHSKTGAVELYLNHLVDGPGEYVVVDMTAGADTFASGLFTRFDLMVLVAEPTRKGVGVYRQFREYAGEHDVAIAVVGNKVRGGEDAAFLRDTVGDDLLVCFGDSATVRAMEQGRPLGLDALEDHNAATLERLRAAVDAREKNWARFTRQAVEFHAKNARAWGNRQMGEDLLAQIDPDFRLGDDTLLTPAG